MSERLFDLNSIGHTYVALLYSTQWDEFDYSYSYWQSHYIYKKCVVALNDRSRMLNTENFTDFGQIPQPKPNVESYLNPKLFYIISKFDFDLVNPFLIKPCENLNFLNA